MPYAATSWVDGTTALSQAHLNNSETQYTEATNSLEQDLFTAFILSGLVCTKDGTTATQLDVTSGVALIKQTDGTLRRRATSSTNFSTSGNPSTTMYLDLNPDGTFSFGTSHSAVTNHLTICSLTTDGSSNISTVTDARVTTINLFAGALASGMQINGNNLITSSGGSLTLSSLTVTGSTTLDAATVITFALSGANRRFLSLTATDGDDIAFVVENGGGLLIHDYTSGNDLLSLFPAGYISSKALVASGTTNVYGGGNYSLIASASNGAIYSDNGNFKTNGSGTATASAFDPVNGNAAFNCRGNFSGTGSGTVSHGAGTTPNWVGITVSASGSSATVGAASYTSTQVTLTLGSSLAWKGIAI